MRVHQIDYARIMLRGTFPVVLMVAFSTYFAGRGRPGSSSASPCVATAVNVLLDWVLIFGKLGFPALGTVGAAYATIISQALGALVYLALILNAPERMAHGFLDFRFQPRIFARLLEARRALRSSAVARDPGLHPVHVRHREHRGGALWPPPPSPST